MRRIFLPALFFAAVLLTSIPSSRAETLNWQPYESGIAAAKREQKPVIADFFTTWCRDCKKMDKATFEDPGISARIRSGFVPVKVDGDKRKDLAKKYGIFAYPTVIVIGGDGKPVLRKVGFMSKDEFAAFMDMALKDAGQGNRK